MVDFVQTVSDHIGRLVGLDDDALHWVGVAVRESVINAIKHGNAGDERKRVYVEFTPLERESPPGMAIRVATKAGVRSGQRPRPAPSRKLPAPAAVHLPHPQLHGRVAPEPAAEGGNGSGDGEAPAPRHRRTRDCRSVPRPPASPPGPPPDPVFATAVEIVSGPAPSRRRARLGLRVERRGAIDPRSPKSIRLRSAWCREASAEGFPGHDVLAEELQRQSRRSGAARTAAFRSAGWDHQLRARAADLLCLAGAGAGRPAIGGRSTIRPARAFTAERHGHRERRAAARLGDGGLGDALLVTGFPLRHARARARGAVRPVPRPRAPCAGWDRRRSTSTCYVAAGRFDAFWSSTRRGTWRPGARRDRSRRPHHRRGRRRVRRARRPPRRRRNGLVHDAMLAVIGDSRTGRTLHRTV